MQIGFFDSGIGGLTILKSVSEAFPEYDYQYYGDTLNLPYGERSEREIRSLTEAGATYLCDAGCALVIIACNTASVETLRTLQDTFLPAHYPDRKILGVVIPVVEAVIASRCTRVLLIATTRTVSSGKYQYELGKRNAEQVKIESKAMSALVPLIEAGEHDAACALVVEEIDARAGEIDGVVLACTHYTVLTDMLHEHYGDALRVFSQDEIIPDALEKYLRNHPEIESQLTRGGTRNVHLTETRTEYETIARELRVRH